MFSGSNAHITIATNNDLGIQPNVLHVTQIRKIEIKCKRLFTKDATHEEWPRLVHTITGCSDGGHTVQVMAEWLKCIAVARVHNESTVHGTSQGLI